MSKYIMKRNFCRIIIVYEVGIVDFLIMWFILRLKIYCLFCFKLNLLFSLLILNLFRWM